MISYITNRNIRVYNADNQISHNSDYIAKFVFDDEWNGKIKTARFIQDNEHFDVILVNDKCKIPPLKNGHIKIGVFTDSMTSTYADVYFKTSIKDGIDIPEPPEGVYEQLITLIESGMLKGEDGLTPYVGSNNNWWIGDIDTGVLARGTDGEDGYTPVKGVDYFTEEEIQQIQNEVLGGAIGDFEAVVDEETATFNANAENTLTGYNANAQEKFETYNANANSKFSDYNTNAEEKFSKYTSNAEAKLSEYNQNDSDKTALYNANAESKLDAYDSNAQAKFDLYNQNDSEKTKVYNSNAQAKLDTYIENADNRLSEYNENADNRDAEFNSQTEQIQSQIDNKFETYNTNAETKFSEYNSNAESKVAAYNQNDSKKTEAYNRNAAEKLEAYNQNHTEKVAEYNQNAEAKTAEFDSNAAALQTEVDRLRGECDQLAVENRKQENRISALMKLNKGQTYDILPEEGEAASRTAPSGAKYVSVDKVGGKSIVWNQLYDRTKPTADENNGITFSRQEDGSFVANGTNISGQLSFVYTRINVMKGHIYFSKSIRLGDVGKSYLIGTTIGNNEYDRGNGAMATASKTGIASFVLQMFEKGLEAKNEVVRPRLFDLTLMFGAGNEPTAEQLAAMFPAESYPYNPGEIISSRTETITVGTEPVTTGFQELRSAMAAHDYIDLNGGKTIRNIGKIKFSELKTKEFENGVFYINHSEIGAKHFNASCLTPGFAFIDKELANINPGECNGRGNYFRFVAPAEIDTVDKFMERYGDDYIYFELATPTTEPVAIPEPLQEWLPVEPDGTVTFQNADESKQLAVPNAVSWVRKLNEVN